MSIFENMPLVDIGPYAFQTERLSLIEHAISRFRADCMAKRGFPQLAQLGVERGRPGFSELEDLAPLFSRRTVEEARRSGFGEDERPQKAKVVSSDPAFDDAMSDCTTEMDEILGVEYSAVRDAIYAIYNMLVDERQLLYLTPAERALADAAVEPFLFCVGRRGCTPKRGRRTIDGYGIGLPTGALGGPVPARPELVPGTVLIFPPIPARRYIPTPDESRLAIVASECAQATHYGDKIAEQQLRILRTALVNHETEILAIRHRADAVAEGAARFLAS